MIKSFYFHNFKSFTETELDISDLTILIGSNASGKTNVIEALRILSESAAGQPLSIIMDGSRNTAGIIRGGSAGCPKMPRTDFELGCTWEGNDYKLIYRIKMNVGKGVQVVQESLDRTSDNKTEKIFSTTSLANYQLSVKCLSDKFDEYFREISVSSYMSVLSQIIHLLPTDNNVLQQGRKYIETIVKALRKIFFFDPKIEFMRNYVHLGEEQLQSNGSNLSAVLYELCETSINHKSIKNNILSIIRNLPDNEIEDIAFVKTPLNDVTFLLKEKYNDFTIEAKRLSDGTLRCLAMLAVVYSEEPESIIVMEDPDNGIHPSRIKSLLQAICRIQKERNLTLIITTHNPVLMDVVDDDNAEGVVVCYRDQKDGSGKFLRMVDFPDYFKLAAKGSVGKLAQNDEFLKALNRPPKDFKEFYDWLEKE